MTEAPQRQLIGQLVITPRPLSDYRKMFLLQDADLIAGPILDCPGGASPFGAEVRSLGGTVVSVDPAYHLPYDALRDQVRRDVQHCVEWTGGHPDNFDWEFLGSLETFRQKFETAAEAFLADYAPDNERYVAAALPELPFADRTFRLALSSHLLFCYPEYLSTEDHIAAILELMRVADEARIYPLVDTVGRPHPDLDTIRQMLAERGVRTEILPAGCEQVIGSSELLTCSRIDQ